MLDWMEQILTNPGYVLSPLTRFFIACLFIVSVGGLLAFVYAIGLVIESIWLGATGAIRR